MQPLTQSKKPPPPPRMTRADRMFLKMYRSEARIAQGGKCAYCHEPISAAEATGDHVKPRVHGGETSRKNTKAACEPCNKAKAYHSEKAFLRMIKSPQHSDPIAIWMAYARRRIWLATERACKRIMRLVE